MTLLSTMQTAKTALHASQLGIQVSANNIANADTPGYVREKLLLAPAADQTIRGVTTGTGVQTLGVVRQIDEFLQQRLRSAASDLGNGQIQKQVYAQLEAAMGELSDGDLSTSLTDFFNSVGDVLNQPENAAVRNLAVLRGGSLAEQIRHLNTQVGDIRGVVNDQVAGAVSEVNRMVKEIATLNTQIMHTERGGLSQSDAVGLRDKRDKTLADLSKIIDIQVEEQTTGMVNVFVGGDYLVFDGTPQFVETTARPDHDLTVYDLQLSRTKADFTPASGELAGLMTARDEILSGFLDDLDSFTGTLIYEFNKIHASGQGVTGYEELVGEYSVSDSGLPLDAAGLSFTPSNGSFQVEILNPETGIRKTYDLFVELQGLDGDTTLESLATDLDAIDGLSAQVRVDGRLVLESESPGMEFGFANDTSGALAALGLNTFFTGQSASSITVNERLVEDPGKFAMSQGGIGHDTGNGERLANMLNSPFETRDGATLSMIYEKWVGETAQSASLTGALADGFETFHATLEGEHLGLTGVSLDEEAITMMTLQRTFQAAARLITTVSEMLDVLVNL